MEVIKKMCNKCDCENYDRCSIMGTLPIDFCCSMCFHYSTTEKCESSSTSVVERSFSVLPKSFCLKAKESARFEEIELYEQ